MVEAKNKNVTIKSTPTRAEDLVWREIEGEIVILTEDGKNIHTLNTVGSVIWELIDGQRDVEDISKILRDKYDVSLEEAQKDTLEFLEELANKNILTY